MPRSAFVSALCLLALALLPGCAPAPSFPELPTDSWTEQNPGGATGCSRGTDFAWWVRGGSENKLVIDFFGGGACWNDTTCSVADAIFTDSVGPIREAVNSPDPAPGIYNLEHDDNPFADWYHAVIPYCTGDVHWGDNTVTYRPGDNSFDIDHIGAINARAVLDWLFAEFSAPEQVFVTGCSAGSYGSILWAAYIAEQWPDTEVVQLGDSGAGVITDTFFQDSFPQWNAEAAFPAWIDSLDPAQEDIQGKELADLYVGIADNYPNAKFSQFNTVADSTQVNYFNFMGGGGDALWTEGMRRSIDNIEGRAENFCSYLAPGDTHCIVTRDELYTVESDGVRLLDWINDLLAGDGGDSVTCPECADE